MSRVDDLVALVTGHSKAAIAVMLVLTIAIGAGAPMVDQSSSLDQFQSESDASQKLDYIEANFQTDSENSTTAQIIVRGDDVLSKDALVRTLEYERTLYQNETIGPTLADDDAITGVANVVALASIQTEQGREVQRVATELQERQSALEERSTALNDTADLLQAELTYLRQNPDASAAASFESVRANSSVELNQTDAAIFQQATDALRNATSESEAQEAYRVGTQGVLADDYRELQSQAAELESLAETLETERAELEDARNASIDEQIEQLESMNESAVDSIVATVLAEGQNGNGGFSVFALMPSDYEPGSTSADATMLVVQQSAQGAAPTGQVTDDAIIDAQLAMQTLGAADGQDYLVFGAGIISEEINTSMTDSLLIVGPLAVVFVLLALAIAYRDVLDILLGLFGIAAVLTWTFGFMGWTDIAFNQIFIAVPVLLIGLSIDYAIHIFMRHREERQNSPGEGVRGSMKIALGGVGVALVWVTATTVIGFLSNLTSPVPPIQEFGVVSSWGIFAALLVFGVLIPALKVEIDGFLESRGWDRQKRAFGTGGGRFSSVLAVGSTAARKAPAVVLVLTLLVTAAGAYGATQVDTSFDQEDFLAEEPADWMKDLPEPFAPGEYSAKQNLRYVNERFVREDSQAQILLENDVTGNRALQRVQAACDAAAEKDVTQTLSNGQPAIQGPLSTMQSVAAQNESFAETFRAADTDGDGVPDQNVAGVYDAFFDAAPDQASAYVYQNENGEYEALRLVVSVQGGASGEDITTQMRDVADAATGDGVEATATGSAILNKIVQDQLLETVVQSLLITLVAVFAFLMVTYRVTDGSATLGAVTLLPVVLSVAWILGTMYLAGIPFNVLTGMITSLTVGLGVAYSIHLSERYTQELERSGSVWESMRTAVTGTGGALLGSAATTVGGFGVLAFAILPPLQQFGIITGLTIIYAFLAAVLVLPTLLVIWTKYLGPDWAKTDFEEGGGNAGSDHDDSDDDPSSGDGATPSTPADAAANGGAVAASTAAGTASTPSSAAVRELDRDVVQPGGTVRATVEIPDQDGRVALSESVRGGAVTAVDADSDPVEAVVGGDGVHVTWHRAAYASATYEVTVPETAPDGSEVTFVGHVLASGEERDVAGDASVTVVADIFERVFAQAAVTDDDLAAASAAFREGGLTADEYDRVVREWVRERPVSE
ncbi:MMPL family transporter [Halobacterium wangiae]|uniref:MMPL family transporter n=1 Tax=Halobacterium wangiae TaxID=2902623 RepID=UPI001E4052BD|nr:MMPL family transporter [Halobacterium wangiae]